LRTNLITDCHSIFHSSSIAISLVRLTSSASGQIFYDHYLENKLNRLKAECIAEDTAQKEREPHLDFRTICDPEELEGWKSKDKVSRQS
jgi:hypothetical protein